jgi:hypothetical protein
MIIHINGVDREATEAEIAEIEAVQKEAKAAASAQAKIDAERAQIKETALSKLGLTADELAALFA